MFTKVIMFYSSNLINITILIFFCSEGFNLLLYGFGSKRQIINDFRTSMLEEESVLVINGFFPGLTLKEVRILIVAWENILKM